MRTISWLSRAALCATTVLTTHLVGCSAGAEPDADAENVATAEAAVTVASPAIAVDWNRLALQVDPAQRTVTIVHLAMFDAINAIEGEYEPYSYRAPAPRGASSAAAAVQAAYRALISLVPAQAAAIEAQRTASLATIPDGPSKTSGIAVGDAVGAAIVAQRSTDKYNLPNPVYVPGTGPDDYQLTPPGFVNPIQQNAGLWTPFALKSADQFRGNGPPNITSGKFASDFNEVKTKGVACPDPTACPRTPAETDVARFFIELPWQQLFRVARDAATAEGFDLYTAARFFALLGIAQADAQQSVFETKYHYNFLRPVTAIRQAATDGNPATDADPTWNSLLPAPPHPEYPSAHAVIQFAMVQVFEEFLGRHYGFDVTSTTSPTPRHFSSFEEIGDLGKEARILGGIHFREAVEDGEKQGIKVGDYIVKRFLRRDHHHCRHH
jgi:hypothetical protein